ncbi:MAG: hypothetical protein LHW44_06585 [Candidatus Cloacimonetes bacterium]|nr:hypothetical protein [Candidatus Cloacimonadota bacterium]
MKRILLALILISLTAISYAQMTAQVIAQNQSPDAYTFGSNVNMRIEVNQGNELIKSVYIRYRPIIKDASELNYRKIAMSPRSPGSDIWEGTIKHSDIGDKDIEYYYEFTLLDDSVEKMPWDMDVNGAYMLVAGALKSRLENGFVLLSQDGDIDQSDGFIFAVSYLTIADHVDENSIRVWVGGKDVTKKATITDNTIIYRGSAQAGEVRGMITAKIDGENVQSPTWTTTSTGKIRLPITYYGSVNFASNIYDYNIKDPQSSSVSSGYDSKNEFVGWGDVTASMGRITAFSNIYMNSHESSKYQRINRYTMGLRLPSFEIIAGDYSPTISPLTMNNRNLFGLSGRLYSHGVSLELSAGEMQRATLLKDEDDTPLSATFKQEAIGFRLRMGPEDGFSIGINGTRNRDIISSLDENAIILNNPNAGKDDGDDADDTEPLHSYIVKPQDNLVLSVDVKLNIPDQRVVLGAELAGSLLNRDTRGGVFSADELEQIGGFTNLTSKIDLTQLADIFVVNRNMEPLYPNRENLNWLAWMAYFRTYFWNNLFNISYSNTGSAFNALSTNYLQKDNTVLSITDQFFLGRTFTLTGGYNHQTDNLSKDFAETNHNISWFAQGLLRIANYPYLKAAFFNTDFMNKNNPAVQPASKFTPYKLNSKNLSVGMGYDAPQIPILPSQFDISYRMNMNDRKEGEAANEDLIFENFDYSVNFSMSNRMLYIPLRTQFVLSLANNKRDLGFSEGVSINELHKNSNFTFFGRTEYSLFDSRMVPYLSYRRVNLTGDQKDQSYDYLTVGIDSVPLHNLSVGTCISQKYHRIQDQTNYKNDSFTWRFQVSQRF